MPRFAYTAIDGQRTEVRGVVLAESRLHAASALVGQGLHPLQIEPARYRGEWLDALTLSRGLSGRGRADLFRQLADLTGSGMPLLPALTLVGRQSRQGRRRRILDDLCEAIGEGQSLSQAMAMRPKIFAAVHVSLVHAGEIGGLLPQTLGHIAELEDREVDLRQRLQAALTYPTVAGIAGLGTLFVVLRFVVPRLTPIFADLGRELPTSTRILVALSEIVQRLWHPLGFALLAAAMLAVARPLSTGIRRRRDQLILRLPRVGTWLTSHQLARFADIMASLLDNGVPILEALTVTSGTLENRELGARIMAATAHIEDGQSIGSAFDRERVFPPAVNGMIAVGESSGNLAPTLSRIGANARRDSERLSRLVVGLIEPALILVLGAFVAFVVAAVVIPIFQVNLAL